MNRRTSAALRATIGFAAFLAIAASDVNLEQTIGTVKAVDPEQRRVVVITGCGHALRVMVFEAGTGCRIQVGGVGAPLTSLKRGQIVVVRHRNAAQRYAAESIATLPAAGIARQP